RGSLPGIVEHRLVLVEADKRARQEAREKAGSAGHVERSGRRQRGEREAERLDLLPPAGPIALGEAAGTAVPLVVLGRAPVVVRLHASYTTRVQRTLESVPNFSEGRDRTTIDALAAALRSGGARLLDVHADEDHNRSVFTLVRSGAELVESLLAGIARAAELIDLREHEGAHPRIGAADVVPLVPLAAEDEERAREAAGRLAVRVGEELGLPVFLYGALGEGRGPAFFRQGG